jgi:hypothetical protein
LDCGFLDWKENAPRFVLFFVFQSLSAFLLRGGNTI